MTVWIDLFVLLLVICILGYRRAAPMQWVSIVAIMLACITAFQTWALWSIMSLWLMYLAVVFLTVVPMTRRLMLTKPLFQFFISQLPPMSDTEKAAIDAGDTWWDKTLFSGHPHWASILKAPVATLSTREQAFLDNEVNTLCAMLDEWHISHEANDLPEAVWQYIKQQGFFGLKISEEYGGLGFSELAHSHVIVKIATRSVSAAVTVMVPNSLGPAELLVHYGTP
jgi:Acyl-CoA dehydrogenases